MPKFIQEVRKPNEFMEDFELKNDIPHAYLLKLLKSKKMANCKESAILTLCALYANGYYTSQRVNLSFDYTITDKETKNELLKGEEDLDHSFVLTNFNNPKRKNLEDTIVVDSWLEYTGTLREANGKYKMLFGDIIDCKIQNIANEKNIDLKKCNVRINPFLTYTTKRTEQEAKRIGEYTRRTYPELIFD